MQKVALEEAAVTDTTNEQQPETPPPPETTAIVPTEPKVIEGEFVELAPAEVTTPPKQKPYWLLIPLTILFCLVFLAASLLLPLFTPTATVTIIPVERTITITAAIQVHGRQLPALTLMQSISVKATGKGHLNARHAIGSITFYNGSFSSQTIAKGTTLTGRDGAQIITDQAAIIPAGNPPIYGQVSVLAHAIVSGSSGNIPAYDINQACCATSVLAKNTQDFTGGASARDFHVVTRTDINNAVASLLVTLSQSETAALQAQLHQGEDLLTPSCAPSVSSNHKSGDEAKHVEVTVSVACLGIGYDVHQVDANATQLIHDETTKSLGTGYRLLGDMQVRIVRATITDRMRGIATLTLILDAAYVYTLTPGVREHLVQLVAGKPTQQAINTLLHFPGIQAASIRLAEGNTSLPADPNHINMIVIYRSR